MIMDVSAVLKRKFKDYRNIIQALYFPIRSQKGSDMNKSMNNTSHIFIFYFPLCLYCIFDLFYYL